MMSTSTVAAVEVVRNDDVQFGVTIGIADQSPSDVHSDITGGAWRRTNYSRRRRPLRSHLTIWCLTTVFTAHSLAPAEFEIVDSGFFHSWHTA